MVPAAVLLLHMMSVHVRMFIVHTHTHSYTHTLTHTHTHTHTQPLSSPIAIMRINSPTSRQHRVEQIKQVCVTYLVDQSHINPLVCVTQTLLSHVRIVYTHTEFYMQRSAFTELFIILVHLVYADHSFII